jgi:tetratricopeptide (TPR) repeat protein
VAVRTRVTESSRAAPAAVKGWQRHVEGWQAGLVAIFVAGTAALLAVPRPVPPWDLPQPEIRPGALAAIERADGARARDAAAQAQAGTLDYDVRLLGDAIRAFGRAESSENALEMEQTHHRAVEAAHRAIARSPDAVSALRAYQARAFVQEMHAFERTGAASNDLMELGGSYVRSVEAYGWYDRAVRRLAPDDAVLATMYKKRWNELTDLKGPALAVTLDEERVLYRFLLARPALAFVQLPASAAPAVVRARAIADQVAANEKRLQKIRDLAAIDPEYPRAFAEGVVLYRLGRFEAAAVAFQRHLEAFPDGPWTLRAQNHLKAALEAR